MVCFELFVRAAIRRMRGVVRTEPARRLPLVSETSRNAARPTYHPVRMVVEEDTVCVHPVDWVGSADLRCTVLADGMALLPQGDAPLPAGTRVEYFPW